MYHLPTFFQVSMEPALAEEDVASQPTSAKKHSNSAPPTPINRSRSESAISVEAGKFRERSVRKAGIRKGNPPVVGNTSAGNISVPISPIGNGSTENPTDLRSAGATFNFDQAITHNRSKRRTASVKQRRFPTTSDFIETFVAVL